MGATGKPAVPVSRRSVELNPEKKYKILSRKRLQDLLFDGMIILKYFMP